MFIFRLISKSIITFAFAKIMQTSAMGTCSHIAECSLSYAKIWKNIGIPFLFRHFFILFCEYLQK